MGKYHKHSEVEIQKILQTITDPYTGANLLENNSLNELIVNTDEIELSLIKSYPAGRAEKVLKALIQETLAEKLAISADEIELLLKVDSKITPHSQKHAVTAVPSVGNIIAVSSGKGGVGKSTVSVNIALALQQQGANVGILDADIYGPSVPKALNVSDKPEMQENKMLPLTKFGLQIMSIGLMIDQETPMIWRGPMVTQALEQMMRNTAWGQLDYLILDLPPGTGDVQLTLAQKTPLAGAVVVTTPQDIALLDVKKAIKMFEKVEVPLLGIVENMSTHICSNCAYEEAIFGQGGGDKLSEEYNIPVLGGIPLDINIRTAIDAGLPTVAKVAKTKSTQVMSKEITETLSSQREIEIADHYHDIALKLVGQLAARKKDYRTLFPKIEISNT